MRALVGKTFGIGNACLTIPLVKALRELGYMVDVLVGSGPDDFGAIDVFMYFLENHKLGPNRIYQDQAPMDFEYDVAIMAIPFDGRWQQGVHFNAKRVMDGRKRPDNAERLGFDMWKKHEVSYQMENAIELGFTGAAPNGEIDNLQAAQDPNQVYLGIGYKRDPGGFGESKHFGTDRFGRLMHAIRDRRPKVKFVSTGSVQDWIQIGGPLVKKWGDLRMSGPLYRCKATSLLESFRTVEESVAYLGNDTGMMHVAAAFGVKTFGLFAYPDLLVKNPPYTPHGRALLFAPDTRIDEIADNFVSFVWG
jgi:ADP-heptose:LPS heptosyltransferase